MSQPVAALRELLAPVVAAHGVDLEAVSVTRAGSRSVVRVVVDRDGGLDLDGVAEVSHSVNAALDAAGDDVIHGSFVLEVTTPGVDRPLTEPRHWRRAAGRLVKVTRKGSGAGGGKNQGEVGGKGTGSATTIGRVVSAGVDAAVLADPASGAQTEVAYADVSRAVVQIEFNAPASSAEAS